MFALTRLARRQALPVLRRGYAEAAAPTDKIILNFVLPTDPIFTKLEATQVNLPTTAGDIGILANHVPTIQQLRPGIVEVTESAGSVKQYFVSGGFATVNEGSTLNINAVDAYDVNDLSLESIKNLTAEATKNSTSSDELVAAEAKIELEVLEALAAVAK